MNTNEVMKKLQKPFKADEIEWRVGSTNKDKTKGLALAYVTNRAIQNRLDEVFGCFNWQNEFKEWKGNSQICGISVYDEDKNQWITKWDGSDDSQTEAVKGGLSDSMKRAAYQWGIGRYLYELPQVWAKLREGKYLDEIPTLPNWALPEEEQNKQSKQQPNIKHDENKFISGVQEKALVDLIKNNSLDIEAVKTVLTKYKVKKVSEIKITDYAEMKKEIEKLKGDK
jgi:hypothetical protein